MNRTSFSMSYVLLFYLQTSRITITMLLFNRLYFYVENVEANLIICSGLLFQRAVCYSIVWVKNMLLGSLTLNLFRLIYKQPYSI